MAPINYDYGSATPLDPAVWAVMEPFFTTHFGNPSASHPLGDKPREAVALAREQVASLLGSRPEEVFFTSCASESNNTALKGLAAARREQGDHIITTSIEHFSVLNPLRTLEKEGFRITILPVDRYGLVEPAALEEAITDRTILVSIAAANPEIGTIQPLAALAAVSRAKGVPFHSDATAAAGHIPLPVHELGVDLLTLAADQLYGPKGAAALFVRRGLRLRPLVEGGIQERGMRAGTENVPAIAGFGEAARLAQEEIAPRAARMASLRDELAKALTERVPHLHFNGHPVRRLPHNLHVSVEFVEGEALLMHLAMAGIYAASGSSCTSHALKSSHVLAAVGLPPELAQGSLLFTLGRDSRREDIPYVAGKLAETADKLRQMSPLYHSHLKKAGKGGKGQP